MSTIKYCTENDCYKQNGKLSSVSYLIVHSPAVYPVIIRALSGSGGGWFKRWNKPGVEKLVHGFIDDTGVYEFAPQTMSCWHVGNSWGNKNTIGYEFCELESKADFNKLWDHAVTHYAGLCKKYNLTPDHILGHQEAHKKGIASNHGDPDPYFKRFGKSMVKFRAEVKAAMEGKTPEPSDGVRVTKTYSPWVYARVSGLPANDPILNVRSGPGVTFPVVRQLRSGNEVDVMAEYENGWSKINIVGTTGYVNKNYLSIKKVPSTVPTMHVVNCSALYVRETPNGTAVGVLKGGLAVEVIGEGKDSDGDVWKKVRSGVIEGYVWPKYLG